MNKDSASLRLDTISAVPPGGTRLPRPTSVAVLIPTFNERENLPLLVPAILGIGESYAVIVIDDHSPDGTGRVADDLERKYPGRIEVIHRARKEGIGSAYIAGMRLAMENGFQGIALMDADLSHDPRYLPDMVALVAEYDLVLGSRYVRGGSTIGWSRWRRALSRIGGWYARLLLDSSIADLTSGFRVMRRDAVRSLPLDEIAASGFAFNLELTHRLTRSGCTVKELPIEFRERVAGASKLTLDIVVEGLIVVWKLRRIRQANSVCR